MDSDSDPRAKQPAPIESATSAPASVEIYWLEYAARNLELRRGETLIGRSSSCHLVLDDPLVSRRHGRIVVGEDGAKVEDLNSANGIFVNSARIRVLTPLKSGDHLHIGKQEFVLRSGARMRGRFGFDRALADTLQGKQFGLDVFAKDDGESTRRGDALELLGGVADKVLARGGGEEAERVLASALSGVLSSLKSGDIPAHESVERAANYAAKLATATGHGRWIDYAVELYTAYKKPLPAGIVDMLYTVLRRVDGINLVALRAYLAVLHAEAANFGPNERFLVQRVEGLERLAALK